MKGLGQCDLQSGNFNPLPKGRIGMIFNNMDGLGQINQEDAKFVNTALGNKYSPNSNLSRAAGFLISNKGLTLRP